MTDIVKDQALLIAKEGPFRVLVPDLYKGKLGVDAEEASHVRTRAAQRSGFCLFLILPCVLLLAVL